MSGKKPNGGRTGVFVDFSNLFHAIGRKDSTTGKRLSYDICYIKLRQYLEENHATPVFYNVYVCVDAHPKTEPHITRAKKHGAFLNWLMGHGYTVIKKDLKYLGGTTKCDTDVEITMDLHKYVNDIDNIILFTGDSDFLSAVQYFQSIGKYVHIYSFQCSVSWELTLFAQQNPRCNYTLLDTIRMCIEKSTQ
jgi:uncharacterized LabA/DUF88 family protein